MKGGINFELKADNIIHALVDTPKHFINISEILPDWWDKQDYIWRKEKARLLWEIQHGRQEWLVFLLACLCENNAIFHPRKDKIHVSFLYFLDKSELPLDHLNLIDQPTYHKNKTWDTHKDLQSVVE